MSRSSIKSVATVAIIVLTFGFFARFLATHPDYVENLLATSPWVIVAIVGVNLLGIGVLSVLYMYTLNLTGHTMPKKENFLLTIYSTIANFFGPLQSGPGVRAAYLKTRYKVSLKSYTLATLIYYGFFAIISAAMLGIGTLPWWQTLLGVIAAGAGSYVLISFLHKKYAKAAKTLTLSRRLLVGLFLLTLAQLLLIAIRYFVELRSIDPSVSVGQALSYTGAANFSLFVSITPDGIGIKEAFLLAAQSIHGINASTIVAASILDRATYMFTLFLLFLATLALHVKEQLHLRVSKEEAK
jgi:uncharacterized membrane protein YbhN (UPF0104 family)